MESDRSLDPIHGVAQTRPAEGDRREPTWQGPLVMLGLASGIQLMGIQLGLLTLAFNLYLSGERGSVVLAAAISGLVFLGGVGMLFVLDRAPVRRGVGQAPARRRDR